MIVAEKDMTGVGVLADGMLLTWHPGQACIQIDDSDATEVDLQDVFNIALTYRLNTLWLAPGSQVSLRMVHNPSYFYRSWIKEHYHISVKARKDDGVAQNAWIQPLEGDYGHKPRVYCIAPDHDPTWLEDQDNAGESWAFSDVEKPRAFMASLVAIYQRFGVHLSTSPASTCIQTMRAKTKDTDWRRDEGELALPDAKPTQIFWHRRLYDRSESGLYLHRADRNSMFLAAATGAELGLGMPKYLETMPAERQWRDANTPGLWQVSVKPAGPLGDLRPHKKAWEGVRWLTTSGVRALHNLGYQCQIQRAWIWPNDQEKKTIRHRRVLKDWASWFWDQRAELRAKYGKENPAVRLAGMMYKRGLGWLDLPIEKGEQPRWYHKRHWYAEIQALAQYRMSLTINQMHEEYGIWPVLVYSDALCYLSSEPDPRKAFPLLFRRETELGGFKHDLTLQVDGDVARAFDQEGPAQVLEKLKKLEALNGAHV